MTHAEPSVDLAVGDDASVVALDVGGTAIKGAVVDRRCVRLRERFASRREDGPDAVVASILHSAESLAAEAKRRGLNVVAAGLGVPGTVDEDVGVARSSANLGWHDIPMRDLVARRLGVPVAFAHDVRTAGLAEAKCGAAAQHASALVVTIGTGIAAALVIDGEVVPGSNNRAGELGQIRVADLNGKATSPLESVASAQALAQRYEKAMSRPPGSFTAPDVIRAATNGDPIAGAVWSDVRARLADVIAAAVCVFDPSVVVIGGGLARAGRALFEPLRADIAQRMPWRSPPDLVRARFLDESGWIGAAILAWRAAGEDADPAGWLDGWAPA